MTMHHRLADITRSKFPLAPPPGERGPGGEGGRLSRRVLFAALLACILLVPALTSAYAQSPADLEARALEIERHLLCPQCTNLRLDVCDTQFCIDMRAVIREKLAAGESDQQIIEFFPGRYCDEVLADVPREGFNLVLFGWVAGSVLLVVLVGGVVLWRLRRTATPPPAPPLTEADDRWLDQQLAEGGR